MEKQFCELKNQNRINFLRTRAGMTQKKFALYFDIPPRTVENWCRGTSEPPKYLLDLMEYKLRNEGYFSNRE